jgi:hypothetical protein
MKQYVWIIAIGIFWSPAFGADEQRTEGSAPPAKAPARTPDDLLLDGLDNRLLEELESPSAKPKDADGEADPDADVLDQLGWGTDVGDQSTDPFMMIGRQMRMAERRIGSRDASSTTQRIQRQIVEDIERLIEQMNQQAAEQQSASSRRQASRPDEQPDPDSKAGSGEHPGTSKPAQESETQVRQRESSEARLTAMMETMQQVWGHLPARVREQMQSGMAEEFLPQYERLIEHYYQRLAEQPALR